MVAHNITIPHAYYPRPYQVPVFQALNSGIKRIVSVWHRRAGKDKTFFNVMVDHSRRRKGNYFYYLPTYNQGRKILWDGKDKSGFPFLSHVPAAVIKNKNNTEMKIDLAWGSQIQVIGTDNYDAVMGTNPVGCVFSEYALQDPAAWDYISPILAENGGWALFNYTPRGRNHGWDMYQRALSSPKTWYVSLLTVDDTGAISKEALAAELDRGMPEPIYRQEYYCSFDVGSETQLIPVEWILAAVKRNGTGAGKRIAGVDVARFGDDWNALIVRQGSHVTNIERWRGVATTETTGRVIAAHKRLHFDAVVVDAIGIGAGVADQLREALDITVVDCNVGERSQDTEDWGKYNRLRDELWFRCRDFFHQPDTALVDTEDTGRMISELSNVQYDYAPNGKLRVEEKAKIKERGAGSPDMADALCLTFYEPKTFYGWQD